MATEGPLLHDGGQRVAGTDLSAKQFFAVVQSTTDRQVILASAAVGISGILQNQPLAGQAADIGFVGITKAQIGTAGVVAGDALQVEAASGKLITKGAGVQVGVALEAAAAGTLGTVMLTGPTA